MASILDILRQRKQPIVAPGAPASETIQQVAAAKTGKATAPAGPRTSNIAEQAAAQAGAAQVAQVDQAAALAGTAAQQQEQTIQETAALERREGAQREEQAMTRLGGQQAELDAFQKVFDEGLRNDKLRQKLRFRGEQERWDKQANFEIALQRDIFGQSRTDLLAALGHKNLMSANDREFEIAMSKISIEDALEMAKRERQDAATREKYQAIGDLGATGVGVAAKAGMFDTAPAQTPTSNESVGGVGSVRQTTRGLE